jgi:type I restriction enzyme S subunit
MSSRARLALDDDPPVGWIEVRIGDALKQVSERVGLLNDVEYDLISIRRRHGGMFHRERLPGRAILTKNVQRVVPGTFVIARRQIVHGACAIAPPEFADSIMSMSYSAFRGSPICDERYFFALSQQPHMVRYFWNSSHGVVVEKLNFQQEEWLSYPVRLPPLREQRRIAEILDAIDGTIRTTERVIAKLSDVHAGLVRDRLSEIDLTYSRAPLLSLCSLPKGQVDPRVEPFRSMTLVAPDHIVGGGRGRLLARESAGAQGAISGKYRFRPGDVVYSKIRPELRKAWLADSDGLCSADMYPLTPGEALDSGYLAQVILGDRFSRFAASMSGRSSGMPKVNREELSEFEIAVPPTSVQVEVGQLALDGMARIDAEIAVLEKLTKTRAGLAADLLSGRVRTAAA